MIDGLRIEVKSDELVAIMRGLHTHHVAKAKWYREQADNLRAGGHGVTGHSNDPTGSLENSAKGHDDKARMFQFMAEHVIGGETYRLEHSDLRMLEIVSGHY